MKNREIDRMCISKDAILLDVLRTINETGKGIAFLVDDAGILHGVLTDGDVRRVLLAGHELSEQALPAANRQYIFASVADSPEAVLAKFTNRIRILPVIDEQHRLVNYYEFKSGIHMPLAKPDLAGNELRYLMDAFLSSWISSTGKYLDLFESSFSAFCGTGHGIAVSNGTVALHLALTALGIGKGHEVIVPDLTFAATINTVLHAQATPVIVDVERDSWCIDPAEIEKAITPRTRAIVPVHLYGQPADMDRIMAIARKHGLAVIEDCAEAHGALYDGRKVGSIGDIGCFSFYGNKVITTGEGGMCVTGNAELDARMRLLRDHGMSKQKRYWHDQVGFNYRMTNLQAAIGLAQTERIEAILAQRDAIEAHYRETLRGIGHLEFQQEDLPKRKKITWLVCTLLQDRDRDTYIEGLKQHGLEARPFFYSLSDMPIYRGYAFSNAVSRDLSARGICLPATVEAMHIQRDWFAQQT